ncbi:cytochrome P450 10 [Octopus bimaculoides]|uniref:cytochrome P450 10 n=1 Tax=Octopus bimaculoides TaxID=37653 RepID=UPI0022E4330D|nr:cytochrome P450 10 [Octopus bimaculoides]
MATFRRLTQQVYNKSISCVNMRKIATSATGKQRVAELDDTFITECPMRKTLNVLKTYASEERASTNLIGRPFEEIPGPKGLPILGTLLDYFKKDGLSFTKMFEAYNKRALEYGPIFREQITTVKTVVISDLDEYSKVIKAEGRFPHRREMEPMMYHRHQRGVDLGLINSQGEEWHKYRSVLSRKLLLSKEIQQHCSAMDAVANDFITRLDLLQQSESGEVHNLEHEIFKWSMESVGTVLFEERIGCLDPEPPKLALDFIANLVGYFKLMQPLMYNAPIYKIFPTKQWNQFVNFADNVMNIGKTFVERKINKLQKEIEDGNVNTEESSKFLSYLLTQKSLSLCEATSSAVDLLSGAVETVSISLLLIAFYHYLQTNPQVQEEIHKEVCKVVTPGEELTSTKLANIPLVKACLKEALRIYPITFATSRVTNKDIEVCGYHIPANTHVQCNVYGLGRNSDLFPQPLEFRPKRWIGNRSDNNGKALYNLTWGHGPRMCIGRRIAEQEIFILLTKIIQNFRLEYNHEDVQPVLNTVMTPDRPLLIKFIPRHPENQ